MCFLVQQPEPGRHQMTARMKWNKEVNKVVMECFYRGKPFDEAVTFDEECLENGEIEDCLNQQNNVYVTKREQLGKQLKDK